MEKEIIRNELYHVQKKFHRMRIDKLTSILFSDLSRSEIKIKLPGNILLNKNTCSPHKIVKENDEIQFNIKLITKILTLFPMKILFLILYMKIPIYL